MRGCAGLKRRQVLLERRARRVRHPRILVTLVLSNLLLCVSRGEIDRHIHRAGSCIRLLAGMNSARGKALLQLAHEISRVDVNPLVSAKHSADSSRSIVRIALPAVRADA